MLFRSGKFEDMYNDAAEKVDEIAERILMLGGTPANKFSDYLKVANISEVDKVSNGEQALNNILQSISYLIGEERKILSIFSAVSSYIFSNWLWRTKKSCPLIFQWKPRRLV